MAETKQGDFRVRRRQMSVAQSCPYAVPSPEAAGQSPIDKRASAAARKALRRGHWRDTEPARLAKLPPGWSPRQCQFIAGDPSARDSCKCGAAAIGNGPYCRRHQELCYRSVEQSTAPAGIERAANADRLHRAQRPLLPPRDD